MNLPLWLTVEPLAPPQRKFWLDQAFALASAICVLCLRPSVIGEIYSFPVSAMLSVFLVLRLLANPMILLFQSRLAIAQFTLFCLLLFYAELRLGTSIGAQTDVILKGIAIDMIAAVIILVNVADPVLRGLFYRYLAFLLVLVCVSVVLSFLAQIATGGDIAALKVGHLEYTYNYYGEIIFPLTFVFNQVEVWSYSLARMSGIFREPGILPALACWGAGYAYAARWGVLPIGICLAACVCSLSSLGPLLAAWTAGLLLCVGLGLRTWGTTLALMVGALVFGPFVLGLDGIGLNEKLTSDSGSFEDRSSVAYTALAGANLLFGDGNGWSGGTNEIINMLGEIRVFGLIYFVAQIAAWLMGLRQPRYWLAGILPLLFTCLFSQPIGLTPISIAIALSWLQFSPQNWVLLAPAFEGEIAKAGTCLGVAHPRQVCADLSVASTAQSRDQDENGVAKKV